MFRRDARPSPRRATHATTRWIAAAILSLAICDPPVPAGAELFIVDTTADEIDVAPGDGLCDTGTGSCGLRAAVQESNALPGADRIAIPAGIYVLTRTDREDDRGAFGDLDVRDDLAIVGAGASHTILDGGDATRVLHTRNPEHGRARVVIRALTIQNGRGEPGGGVLHESGFLTLRGVVIRSSTSPVGGEFASWGGGIFAQDRLMLVRSVVEDNRASVGGGVAIGVPFFDQLVPRVVIRDSAVVGNSTEPDDFFGHGGAGVAGLGQVRAVLRNTTISGNSTSGSGGGMLLGSNCGFGGALCRNRNRYSLNNVTISANVGGGLWIQSVDREPLRVELSNTIVAGNSSADCSAAFPGQAPVLLSRGHNLLGTGFDCAIETNPTEDVIGADPLLAPLADNGGPTPTHALGPGSPARDAGSPLLPGSGEPACEAADQRGEPRADRACDIGAFELGAD